ncbi:SDR family oxidoreductase [Chryseobacterium sp. MMS23-Vi53]|uniref:SDR family oxidoreductase n=1 Tax=Chryseobacterium sp. MMS23-Vi53 TaxID=3386644 RepID=UPI0039E8690A
MNRQNKNLDLTSKIALVTGGTKGIGKAIADRLSESGATVIVTARNQPKEELHHHFIASDLTNSEDVSHLVTEISEKFGSVDILIDNIGGLSTPGGGFSNLTDEHWENELQLNLLSAIRIDRALLPQMIENKNGVIIHISTGSSKQPLWDINMAYAVSKAALNSYSKALASEVATHGIRVLTVLPGAVKTPMMVEFIKGIAKTAGITVEEATQGLFNKIGGVPMGRMAEPEEVAELVNFLASPAASYLTGSTYAVDGGAMPTI